MSELFGFDINNPEASAFARGSVQIPEPYFIGYIEEIIVNEKSKGTVLKYSADGSNIGQALVRLLPSEWNTPKEKLRQAYPLEMNIQDFPLVGEQVLIFKAFRTMYYTRSLSTRRRITENRSGVLPLVFGEKDLQTSSDLRELSKAGIPKPALSNTKINTETTFIDNPAVRSIRPNIGDIIFQGRFGNFIRMGSSAFSTVTTVAPKPNILLTAGLWDTPKQLSTKGLLGPYSLVYENINKDKSSIWMVADQKVKFDPSSLPISSEEKVSEYTGAQIFVNSDRVVLNTKKNEIGLFSKKEINLSASGSITFDTQRRVIFKSTLGVSITSAGPISIDGSELTFSSKQALAYTTPGDFTISGKNIFIGKHGDNTEPMVLGASLALWLNALMIQLLTPGTFLTATGPVTINPLIQPALKDLQNQLGGVVTPQAAKFNSENNFVSRVNK